MSVGIIGLGVVGSATFRCFEAAGLNPKGYDVDPARSRNSLEETLGQQVILISLPTVVDDDGVCDLAPIHSTLMRAAELEVQGTIVIRSTVPVGTTERLRHEFPRLKLGFSPEFLRAAHADADVLNPPMTVYGGEHGKPYFDLLRSIPLGCEDSYKILTSGEAELLKLLLNSFAALKTIFASEMSALARRVGADWDKIVDIARIEGRLGRGYLSATGSDGLPGYDGSCLPKDCRMLVRQLGDASLLRYVQELNCKLRSS